MTEASDPRHGGHDAYFAAMAAALARAGIARPILVVDSDRLTANVALARDALAPSGLHLRLSTKSLQAPDLSRSVMASAGTDLLMAFSGAMVGHLARDFPQADVMLGRPLPAAEAESLIAGGQGPGPRWLIDTPRRLEQYAAIARARGVRLRIVFEIDVGLHRGGFPDPAALAEAVDLAMAEPRLTITGLMGYDAHMAGAPLAVTAEVERRYASFVAALLEKTRALRADLAFNTAGSLTWRRHLADPVANEVAIGSAFLKPAHYDASDLSDFQPALFLAEPVLKATDGRAPDRAGPDRAADPDNSRGFFLYGGYGDARPVSPPGLSWSRAWGRAMLAGSAGVSLEVDDFVFLRPAESEGTLTAFGDIAVFDGSDIVAFWPPYPPAA